MLQEHGSNPFLKFIFQDWAKDGDKEIEVPQVNNFDTDAENFYLAPPPSVFL